MPIRDFYAGTSKKFNITIQYSGSAPDLTSDTIIFYLKDNLDDTSYALTASADVTSSGATGVAKFNILPAQTEDFNPENYTYELVWTLASGDEYVLEQAPVAILNRI